MEHPAEQTTAPIDLQQIWAFMQGMQEQLSGLQGLQQQIHELREQQNARDAEFLSHQTATQGPSAPYPPGPEPIPSVTAEIPTPGTMSRF